MVDSFTMFAAAGAGTGNIFTSLILPFGGMAAIMYFLLIRPQQQQRKRHREMLENLKKGTEVVTSGGLIGKITKITDKEVTLNLGNSEVRLMRAMILDVYTKDEAPASTEKKS